MCAWVRIPLLSNFAFKKPTFWSKQEFWESNEKQDKRIPHYKKVLSKTGWSKCDILKERSKAPDSRKSPLRLLVHECVRGFESHSCQILRSKWQHFNRSSIESHLMSNFAFKKPTFWSKQYFWESNQEQEEADFTLQEGVIEDRKKQVRFTQGRMAERSKAPDSRNSPLRLLVHECVPGFESHSCQILRSKSQHFGQSRSSESQMRSKTNGFHITRRCYRRQDEASAIYSRQDGRAV